MNLYNLLIQIRESENFNIETLANKIDKETGISYKDILVSHTSNYEGINYPSFPLFIVEEDIVTLVNREIKSEEELTKRTLKWNKEIYDCKKNRLKDINPEDIENKVLTYFIKTEDNYVKIGKSTYKSLNSRISSLQTGNHKEIELIALIDGEKYLEADVHELFKEFRVRGEWFILSKEIEDFIDNVPMSRLITGKESDDMIALTTKLSRLSVLTYALYSVSYQDLYYMYNILSVEPIVQSKHVEARFTDVAKHLQNELKTKSIEEIDWGVYYTRKQWINDLLTYYGVFNRVVQTHSRVKNMLGRKDKDKHTVKIELSENMYSQFKVNTTYSRKEIKDYLKILYSKYKIKRTASHRDLFEYFNIKEKTIQGNRLVEILSKK